MVDRIHYNVSTSWLFVIFLPSPLKPFTQRNAHPLFSETASVRSVSEKPTPLCFLVTFENVSSFYLHGTYCAILYQEKKLLPELWTWLRKGCFHCRVRNPTPYSMLLVEMRGAFRQEMSSFALATITSMFRTRTVIIMSTSPLRFSVGLQLFPNAPFWKQSSKVPDLHLTVFSSSEDKMGRNRETWSQPLQSGG